MQRTWYLSTRAASGRLPEVERRRIERTLERYCEVRVPAHLRGELQVGYRIRGTAVTLFERRPAWAEPEEWTESLVAQFRYDPLAEKWSLYWSDRRQKWHPCDRRPAREIASLLRDVHADRSGIFWG